MAAAHSTSKARSGRNPLLKSSGTPKPTNRFKTPAKRRKTHPAEAAKGPAAPGRPGSQVAERGARIRVRGRLQEMIQAYYASRGWDREGNVRREQVEGLHLADLSRTPA